MAYRVSKVVRKKGPQFKIRFEWFDVGDRHSRDIPKEEWVRHGFYESMSWEEANAQKDSLNAAEHLKRHQERRNKIAARMDDEERAQLAYLPGPLIREWEAKMFGRTHVDKKLPSYWKVAKDILCRLKLEPNAWVDNQGMFFDHFASRQYSVSYVQKLIHVLNGWGAFYSRKTQKFFDPLPYPSGRERERIADANYGATGAGNKESDPLTPEMLEAKRSTLKPEHYHWLYMSVWWGLRPSEVDSFKDEKFYKIERHGKIQVLGVYQAKLSSISREKRWKLIPCFLPEQKTALKILTTQPFKRPLSKTVANRFGERVGLYGGRKGFVDLMQSHGQSLEDISQWMGHTSIERTWKNYKNKQKVRYTE
jgi:hypothetical protein